MLLKIIEQELNNMENEYSTELSCESVKITNRLRKVNILSEQLTSKDVS